MADQAQKKMSGVKSKPVSITTQDNFENFADIFKTFRKIEQTATEVFGFSTPFGKLRAEFIELVKRRSRALDNLDRSSGLLGKGGRE
jgi:hypothetical protein